MTLSDYIQLLLKLEDEFESVQVSGLSIWRKSKRRSSSDNPLELLAGGKVNRVSIDFRGEPELLEKLFEELDEGGVQTR